MGEYADDAIFAGLDQSWGWRRPRTHVGKDTAAARCRAHAALDPLWKEGSMTRSEAYAWLAKELGISKSSCHIADFNAATCDRVVEICTRRAFADLSDKTD